MLGPLGTGGNIKPSLCFSVIILHAPYKWCSRSLPITHQTFTKKKHEYNVAAVVAKRLFKSVCKKSLVEEEVYLERRLSILCNFREFEGI